MAKVAFLGLGVMGYPMAGHLKNKGGHDLTVYNRTAAKAEKWVAQHGGKHGATPKKAGLDVEAVIETISKGAAQSWQMENRYKTMVAGKFDFGFAVDWMRKDMSICLGEARKNGANLPVTALVDQFYAEVQKMGGKRWDTSSLIARLDR